MDFVKKMKKDLDKTDIGVGSSQPPTYWHSTGNYVLNKIISGSFLKGIPQGRLTGLTGPSGAGKSFIASNIMREAQQDGTTIVVLDSENALDDEFVRAIGVDPDRDDYHYFGVSTIPEVKKVVSMFVKGYRAEYGDDTENAPKVLFVIDSLNMLLTAKEAEDFDKGVTKGDQGQKNKQLKAMLTSFVFAIKNQNISMIVTSQVYANQNLLNGFGLWIVPDAVKYSLSQIFLFTKLKLKDKDTKDVSGIRMKAESYKSRFSQPGQTVTIEVPYETGMDPYNGLLDAATDMGITIKSGSRYKLAGEETSWYSKDFSKVAEDVLIKCEAESSVFLDTGKDAEEVGVGKTSQKADRISNHAAKQ